MNIFNLLICFSSIQKNLYTKKKAITCLVVCLFCLGFSPEAYGVHGGDHVSQSEFNTYYRAFVQLRLGGERGTTSPGGHPETDYLCGGTLVAPNKVLTAAHCVNDALAAGRKIYAVINGALQKKENMIPNQSFKFGLDQRYDVDYDTTFVNNYEHKHPSYRGINDADISSSLFDIAVLILKDNVPSAKDGGADPVIFDNTPITDAMINEGIQITAIGFGDRIDSPDKQYLKKGVFTLATDDKCQVESDGSTISMDQVQNTVLCVPATSKSAIWHGDSGGPLLLDYGSGKNRYRQIGIVHAAAKAGSENIQSLITDFDNNVRKDNGQTIFEFLQSEGVGGAYASGGEYYQLIDTLSSSDEGRCLQDTFFSLDANIDPVFRTNHCSDGKNLALYWSLPPSAIDTTGEFGPMVNALTNKCLTMNSTKVVGLETCNGSDEQMWIYRTSDRRLVSKEFPNFGASHQWITGRALSPRPLVGAVRDKPIIVRDDNLLHYQRDSGTIHNWHVPPAGYYGIMATTRNSHGHADDPEGTLLCADHVHDTAIDFSGADNHAVSLSDDNPCTNVDGNDEFSEDNRLIWRGHTAVHGSPKDWYVEYSSGSLESNNYRMFNYFDHWVSYTDLTSNLGRVNIGDKRESVSWYQWYEDEAAPTLHLLEEFEDGDHTGWTMFHENGMEQGPSKWLVNSNGELVQTSNIHDRNDDGSDLAKEGTYAIYDDGDPWESYETKLTIRSSDNDAIGVMFRFQDSENYYRFSWDMERKYRRLVKKVNGSFTLLAEDDVPYVKHQEYELVIRAVGSRLIVKIDNETIFDVLDHDLDFGTVALYCWGNTGCYYDDIKTVELPKTFYSSSNYYALPDNDAGGVSSPINVKYRGDAGTIDVGFYLMHPFIRDLVVTLIAPDDSEFTLHDRSGGSEDDINWTYRIDASGVESEGTWNLHIADKASQDIGTLYSWNMEFDPHKPPPHLMMHQSFDEIRGNKVRDVTGRGHDGTKYNGAIVTDGHRASDWALSFDGNNDYVKVPYARDLNPDGSFTVSAWVRPDSTSEYGTVVSSRNNAPKSGFIIYKSPNNIWQFWLGSKTMFSDKWSILDGPAIDTSGQWTHLVANFEARQKFTFAFGAKPVISYEGVMRLYVNGEETSVAYDQIYTPQRDILFFPLKPLLIGAGANEGSAPYSYHFKGEIDEVKIYNKLLTPDEIE